MVLGNALPLGCPLAIVVITLAFPLRGLDNHRQTVELFGGFPRVLPSTLGCLVKVNDQDRP